MAGGLNVTYQELEAAAQKLGAGKVEIEGQLGQLRSMIENLVQNGFVTDSASKQFDASYGEFNEGVKRVLMGLDGMGNYLNKAAQTFRDTDDQLAKALQG